MHKSSCKINILPNFDSFPSLDTYCALFGIQKLRDRKGKKRLIEYKGYVRFLCGNISRGQFIKKKTSLIIS